MQQQLAAVPSPQPPPELLVPANPNLMQAVKRWLQQLLRKLPRAPRSEQPRARLTVSSRSPLDPQLETQSQVVLLQACSDVSPLQLLDVGQDGKCMLHGLAAAFCPHAWVTSTCGLHACTVCRFARWRKADLRAAHAIAQGMQGCSLAQAKRCSRPEI